MLSLTPDGGGQPPKCLSGRLLAAVWWLFSFIIVITYTANLAAFLTVETLEKPISNAEDLANQDVIKYGVVKGGSTAKFFQTSADKLYRRMGEYMNGIYNIFHF